MKLLLDTRILLMAAEKSKHLSKQARSMIKSDENSLFFSPASLWEVVIKNGLKRDDFNVDVGLLRRGLLDNGYHELAITSQHITALESLPSMHKNPIDRLLIAQATSEGLMLLTNDELVTQYPGSILKV